MEETALVTIAPMLSDPTILVIYRNSGNEITVRVNYPFAKDKWASGFTECANNIGLIPLHPFFF